MPVKRVTNIIRRIKHTNMESISKVKIIAPQIERANELVIVKNEDLVSATELLSVLNKHADKVKEEKEKITKPLNEALKAERLRWNPVETTLKTAIDMVRKKMSLFQTEQIKKENEEKLRIAKDKRLRMDTAIEKMDNVEIAEESIETQSGSVKFRTDYEVIVEDIEKVPFKYLNVEVRKADVKAVMKNGIKIPGLSLKEVQVVANKR